MRSKNVKKRIVQPDTIFKSRVITRFVNKVMLDGKKSTAEGIVFNALSRISPDTKESLAVFESAVKNVMPKQEVRSRRIGGATYQIPYPLRHDRAEALAIRWLVDTSRRRKGKDMEQKLYEEITNAHKGIGDSIKKKDDTHKMAEANRAFAHFRL